MYVIGGPTFENGNSDSAREPSLDVTLLGLAHRVQWEDQTGDLQALLERLVEESHVELIAEEANKLPTTIGFRLACRINKPWIDIDMDDAEALRAGIYEELNRRPQGPLPKDGGTMVTTIEYLPHADGVRETYWVKRLMQHRVSSALVLCGLLHLSPFSAKLREKGCVVTELNLCDLDWYKKAFGVWRVVEEAGRRSCELSVK